MIYWITVLLVIICDRLTKYLVTANMETGQSVPVINDFFHLTYIRNPGSAFGFFAEARWVFIAISAVVFAVIVYLAYSTGKGKPFYLITLGLISGGAAGNMIDRLQTGLVIDFLDFCGIWPYIFNVADSCIVVGTIFLAWQIMREPRAE